MPIMKAPNVLPKVLPKEESAKNERTGVLALASGGWMSEESMGYGRGRQGVHPTYIVALPGEVIRGPECGSDNSTPHDRSAMRV